MSLLASQEAALVAQVIAWLVITAGLVQVLLYIVQLLYAALALHKRPPFEVPAALWQRYADLAPPIAIVAPAYNEELSIEETTKALLALHYPEFEVIVV